MVGDDQILKGSLDFEAQRDKQEQMQAKTQRGKSTLGTRLNRYDQNSLDDDNFGGYRYQKSTRLVSLVDTYKRHSMLVLDDEQNGPNL